MLIPSLIESMLAKAETPDRASPPTMFYNEGWLLRIVLDWFSRGPQPDHRLGFAPHARWFSEALLPSRFLERRRPDLAEGYTHADGVIGHFIVGANAKADTSLKPDAKQFAVTEAKMFSPLSSGVTNARYFDQAARTVACIAEIVSLGRVPPREIASLGFFVLAPAEQIDRGAFRTQIDKESIKEKVRKRVLAYESDEMTKWFLDWFQPTLQQMTVDCISWEGVVEFIETKDQAYGERVHDFYDKCLAFNRIQESDFPDESEKLGL